MMQAQEQYAEIAAPPQVYAEWLDCFRILRQRELTDAEWTHLRCGRCSDAESVLSGVETQTVETVNAMTARAIRMFHQALEDAEMFQDMDAIYTAFRRLARQFEGCAFFAGLPFLPAAFRQELLGSLRQNAGAFWENCVQSMYRQCMDQNNVRLEDQLYMIRRIRLFQKCENLIV